MAKRKKTKQPAQTSNGTCAYCGVDGGVDGVAITDDHVFPQSWYPDGFPPSQMLLVPSCSPCNHGYGKREERMFLPLVLMLPTDPRTSGLVERAIRTADPAAGRDQKDARIRRRVGESLLRKTTIVGPRARVEDAMWTRGGRQIGIVGETPAGAILGTPTVEFGWENLEPIAIKFLRGCYYSVSDKPLPLMPTPWARAAHCDPREVVARFADFPGGVTRGRFPFSYTIASSRPERTLGAFVLWDQMVLWASNMPAPAP